MKLAEALAERAALQANLGHLANRAKQNARVQEGDQPPEDPNALLAEYDRLTDAAAQSQDRFTRGEIRYVAMVDVRNLRQQADDLARQAREVDIKIQQVNWTTEM